MVIYGIVPRNGLTMEALWEKRLWANVGLGPDLNLRELEQVVRVMEGGGIEGGGGLVSQATDQGLGAPDRGN